MGAKKQGRKLEKPKAGALPKKALTKARETQIVHALQARTDSVLRTSCNPDELILPSSATSASAASRRVILHYHLFKNAGTSVDELLRQNFASQSATHEFGSPRHDIAAAMVEFIRSNPHLRAISSHTALLPVPQIDGIEIFPIIFVRHPIDRLRSAYEFERRQKANTHGARLAKAHDLRGYLTALLEPPRSRQARNFQTYRLALGSPGAGNYRARALQTIGALPFIGLVDAFEESVRRLTDQLSGYFPEFAPSIPHANAQMSVARLSLVERLAAVRSSVGNAFYQELAGSNADDLYIHEYVSTSYGKALSPE